VDSRFNSSVCGDAKLLGAGDVFKFRVELLRQSTADETPDGVADSQATDA